MLELVLEARPQTFQKLRFTKSCLQQSTGSVDFQLEVTQRPHAGKGRAVASGGLKTGAKMANANCQVESGDSNSLCAKSEPSKETNHEPA